MSKEMKLNVNAEVCKEGQSMSKFARRGNAEHAEAINHVIEKVYSLDLSSPPA